MADVKTFVPPPLNDRQLLAVRLFNEVFKALRQIFPAPMANIKTADDLDMLRRQWVMAFAENGINHMGQIEAGLAMARKTASPFLPSPGQFIEWCQQGNSQHAGLPTAEQLYSEFLTYCKRRGDYESAEDYPWKSAALYWLVTDIFDAMRRYRLTDEEVRKKSESLLSKMEKRLGRGDVIPAPVKRIAPPRHPSGPTPAELLYAKNQQRKEAGLI